MTPRLKEKYLNEIVSALKTKFTYRYASATSYQNCYQ